MFGTFAGGPTFTHEKALIRFSAGEKLAREVDELLYSEGYTLHTLGSAYSVAFSSSVFVHSNVEHSVIKKAML